MLKKRITTLKQVRRYLDSVPSINWGGCGFAAYAMYLWLEKNGQLSEDTTVIYGCSSWYFNVHEQNMNALNNGYKNATACIHAALMHEGKIIDSDETINISEDHRFSELLVIPRERIHHFMQASLRSEEWAEAFNREVYIPKIEEKLGIRFFEQTNLKTNEITG
ncbi:MAG: hypothetical protein KDH96_06940 [Candidatus Riesia sp.]|nr:hypothetical protein [Candidatus Riesia sp.]